MIKAVIVDDELKNGELLELKLKKYCPQVMVLKIFTEPEQATAYIKDQMPDIVFLDIEMPGMTGLQAAELIKDTSEIVFVTAYEKYSIGAVRLAAFDYLLKPIDEKDLTACVQRLEEKLAGKKKNDNSRKLNTQFDKVAVPTTEGIHFINARDIVRVEAVSNYSVFHFQDKRKLTAAKTLKQVEEALGGYSFFRPHKSHIINLGFVSRYIRGEGGTIILTDGSEVELSRNRKKEFLEMFEGL